MIDENKQIIEMNIKNLPFIILFLVRLARNLKENIEKLRIKNAINWSPKSRNIANKIAPKIVSVTSKIEANLSLLMCLTLPLRGLFFMKFHTLMIEFGNKVINSRGIRNMYHCCQPLRMSPLLNGVSAMLISRPHK